MTAIIPIPTRSDLAAALLAKNIAAASLELAGQTGTNFKQAFDDLLAAERNLVRIQDKMMEVRDAH